MLEYGCVKDSCELIIADAKKEELTLTSESRSGKVKLAATTTIEQPYVLKKSKASVRIQLKDVDTSVIFPIKVTQIQLLTGDQLIGEVLINEELQSVRDLFTKTIQLKPTLSEPEQQLSTTIKIDFEYQYIQREETLTERETFSDGFKNQLFFIDYSKVEDE